MSESALLIAYRAMPSHVLKERMRLMESVIAERNAKIRDDEVQRLRGMPYVQQVVKKEAPDHLVLEPAAAAPPPPDGILIDFPTL